MRQLIRLSVAIGLTTATALVATPSPAGAATINVTTTADETTANGQTSLREAMVLASGNGVDDTIVLTAGANYIVDFCAAGPLTHGEVSEIEVQGGAGTSIQNVCIGMTTFEATEEDAELTITDLEMTGFDNGGSTVDGAAIAMNAGHLVLDSVDLHGFDAGDFGTVIVVADESAASGATLSMTDSALWGSTGHGILIARGTATITGSDVHHLSGSGIRGTGANATITGSDFSDNDGTGINFTDGSPVVVTSSTVNRNGDGGVKTTGQGHTSLTVTGSDVSDNGGTGISCGACNDVTVTTTTVTGNGLTAGAGGGSGLRVSWDYDQPTDAPTLDVIDSHIDGNRSRSEGGGIRLSQFVEDSTANQAAVTIDGSTVNDNWTDGFFDNEGGGIYATSGNLSVIGGSEVTGNDAGPSGGLTASRGGGIFLQDGGGLDDPMSLLVDDATLSGNEANSHGGAIYAVLAGDVDVNDSTVDLNLSGSGSGGGIAVAGADLELNRTTIAGNDADVGGGIGLTEFSGYPAGSVTVNRSTLSGNSASFAGSGGGGLFVNVGDTGAAATLNNSTVSGNTSANYGGGIMVMQTSTLTVNRVTIIENEGVTGANVYVAAGDLTVGRSVIARPEGTGDNCATFSSTTVSNGYSYADDVSCNLGGLDVVDPTDPDLGPLTDNGGPTLTHLPAATSPVGGLVPVAACGSGAVDQRGVSRPQGEECEAGAVEITEAIPITGTAGPDRLVGTDGDDMIDGGGGRDVILGGGGDDVIVGGPGADLIGGGAGDDRILGGPHGDLILGEAGDDDIFGEAGADILVGGDGFDHLDGGSGIDLCLPMGGTSTAC